MIRPARPADAAAVCALVQAGFETYRAFAGPGWQPPDERRPEREERWGEGLAKRLHALAVEAMPARGVRSARLITPASQARSRAFYERRGWVLRGGPWPEERGLGLDVVEYGLAPT